MVDVGMIVTLDNGKEYGVVEKIDVHKIEYVLLIHKTDKEDVKICRVENDDKGCALVTLEGEEYAAIFTFFYAKAHSYLNNFKEKAKDEDVEEDFE